MNIGDISTKITFLTNADTNSYTNAQRLININEWCRKVLTLILRSEDAWDFDDTSVTTSYPIAKRNLIANQQDYKFSSALWALLAPEGAVDLANAAITPLKIKRVEITYDGTNWYKAEPFDISQRGLSTDPTTGLGDFQTTRPFYDLSYNALFLYPIPTIAVTKGLKVWFERNIVEFTSSDLTTGTKEPPFDSTFHHIISLGCAYDWAMARGKENAPLLKTELNEQLAFLSSYYGDKDKDRVYQLAPAFVNFR